MLDPGISVLVLYENFAVATVVVRRLLDVPMVHMVRADNVGACRGRYDVVVLDPYLRAHRRAEALRRWAGPHGVSATIIELRDMFGAAGASVLAGEVASGPGQAVLAALGLDSVAA
jgi:hypothetical protein